MFPHLKERVIITAASSSSENMKVADNVALVNGTDLSPILERSDIKKVSLILCGQHIGNRSKLPLRNTSSFFY